MPSKKPNSLSGLAGGIFTVGLVLAIVFHGFNLPIFFAAMALSALVGSLSTYDHKKVYGGLHSFVWLCALALSFATQNWFTWLFIAIVISGLLGGLVGPIMRALAGGILGLSSMQQQPQQPHYQPTNPSEQPYYQPSQPASEPERTYEQGYQSEQPPVETYQEGGKQYSYPQVPSQQYDQPQAQYPQTMPPQQ